MIAETILAILIVTFLVGCGVVELVRWRKRDRARRSERMVHRNLQRIGGAR